MKTKQVTIYVAFDGTEHRTHSECKQHEAIAIADDSLTLDDCYFDGKLNLEDAEDLKNFLERNQSWIKPLMEW